VTREGEREAQEWSVLYMRSQSGADRSSTPSSPEGAARRRADAPVTSTATGGGGAAVAAPPVSAGLPVRGNPSSTAAAATIVILLLLVRALTMVSGCQRRVINNSRELIHFGGIIGNFFFEGLDAKKRTMFGTNRLRRQPCTTQRSRRPRTQLLCTLESL
jgi:hypothetical protein